jgi:hypothetical protein
MERADIKMRGAVRFGEAGLGMARQGLVGQGWVGLGKAWCGRNLRGGDDAIASRASVAF